MKIRYYKVLENRRTWDTWRHVPATSCKALQEKLDEVGSAEEVIGYTPDKTDGDDDFVYVQLEDDQQASERIHRQRRVNQQAFQEKVTHLSPDMIMYPLTHLLKEVKETFVSLLTPDLLLIALADPDHDNGYSQVCDEIGQAIDTHLDEGNLFLLVQLCQSNTAFFTQEPVNIGSLHADSGTLFNPCGLVYHNVYNFLHSYLEDEWNTFFMMSYEEGKEHIHGADTD